MPAADVSYVTIPRSRRLDASPSHAFPVRPFSTPDSEFAERADVLRTVTFYTALALVFVKFGMLAEIQTHLMGFKGYLLYLFGIPAAFGVLVAGGIRRGLTGGRTVYYWIAFTIWLFICVPFSSWKFGSLGVAKSFLRDDLLTLFVIAGLVVSWRECRLVIRALGIAAILNVLSSRMFGVAEEGRLYLDFGTVSNANDYAAHLLLTLPFLLLFVYNSRSIVLRGIGLLIAAYGVLAIVKTASRGALIALVVCALFLFFRGSAVQRLLMLCMVPLLIMAALVFVPKTALQRIRSFTSSEQNASAEALESSDARRYLLQKGLEYTLRFPLFGVGPGQFPSYEGSHNQVLGAHGMWHETHCSWVQASSECGIPGGLLLLAGYVSTFLLLNRTYRRVKWRPDCKDIRNTVFCIMLGMTGFCVAITFLNFAYFFYGPALAGLAISVWRAAEYELQHRGAANGESSTAPVLSFGPALYPRRTVISQPQKRSA